MGSFSIKMQFKLLWSATNWLIIFIMNYLLIKCRLKSRLKKTVITSHSARKKKCNCLFYSTDIQRYSVYNHILQKKASYIWEPGTRACLAKIINEMIIWLSKIIFNWFYFNGLMDWLIIAALVFSKRECQLISS